MTFSIFNCDCITIVQSIMVLYKANLTEERSLYKMGVYKCDVCDKIFTEKRNLLRHEKSTHGEKNSYPCDLCNKVYGRAEHLSTPVVPKLGSADQMGSVQQFQRVRSPYTLSETHKNCVVAV